MGEGLTRVPYYGPSHESLTMDPSHDTLRTRPLLWTLIMDPYYGPLLWTLTMDPSHETLIMDPYYGPFT